MRQREARNVRQVFSLNFNAVKPQFGLLKIVSREHESIAQFTLGVM